MNMGRLVLVEGRRCNHYNQLTFVNGAGITEKILLTDRELNEARARASKNSDDLSGTSLRDKIVLFLINLLG